MDKLKADRKAEMDTVVAKKIAAADKRIKDLKWNYDTQVMARLDTQQKDIDSHTRSKVVWNLKNKKHNFFAAIWDIRKELSTKLSIAKASLWKELQAESDALWASLQESKNKFAAESDRVSRELGDETDALRDELDKRAQAAAEWLSEASNKEATTLSDFLTLHKLSHGGFTISHFAPFHIVTPVFGLRKEAKKIQDSIYEMAEELMPIYEENVRGEIAQGESDKSYLVQRVIAQNTDLIDALEARTDSLIDTIMIERADTENALQTYQKELIHEQVDQVRDIEKRVTETKEAILEAIAGAEADIKQTEKDLKEAEWELSKEIAQQKHHHHHHHRYSYGYGYHSAHYHDPKETEEKIAGLKTKITGFKERITSLKAQIVQFKEDWKLSLKAARDEFSALQGDSLADWEENLALARSDYAAVLEAKEDTFAKESEFA